MLIDTTRMKIRTPLKNDFIDLDRNINIVVNEFFEITKRPLVYDVLKRSWRDSDCQLLNHIFC